MTTAKRRQQSIRPKEARPKKSNAPMIVLVMIGIMAVAALIAARQTSHQSDVAMVAPRPTVNEQPEKMAARLSTETKRIPTPMAPAAGVAMKAQAADRTMARKPAVERAKSPAASAPSPESPVAPAVESTSTAKANIEKSVQVTISGCLEFNDATFWLKDTDGVDAPTSRSWKSGFLRKRSSPIELVDAAHTLKLPTYLGRRVSATGTLVNGEMRARSLQSVAAPCS